MGGDFLQMPRFFVNPEDIYSDHIIISGEDVKHIRNVLRMKRGENLTLCDGSGNEYLAVIRKFEPDFICAGIVTSGKNDTEPPIDVVLYQGIPRSDRMDFIIQKSVELGVKKIVPVISGRSVVRFSGEKDAGNKVARWQRIALEAAKQSNRGIIPQVGRPLGINEAFENMKRTQLGIIPYEKEKETKLKSCLVKGLKEISVMIGPEGGFSENEIEMALIHGVKPVSLGPRILRTETAGIAVISIVMYELGDIG